jgi:branched-chain amino acid transport system permease protein
MFRISIDWWITILLIAVGIVLGVFGGPFWGHIVIMSFLWAGLSAAWNLVGGMAGQISLGNAAFFGIGAYASSILYVDHGISPWIGMLVGAFLGAVAAVIVGIPTFRLRGTYFSLGTFAMSVTVLLLTNQWRDLTRGGSGIPIPFRPGLANISFLQKQPYVLIALVMMVATVAITIAIKRSKLGYQLAAIRGDEDAAESIGVNAMAAKLKAAVAMGAITAAFGTLYAQYILFINPNSVMGGMQSFQPLIFAIIGGMGTITGPLLGALTILPITQILLTEFSGEIPGLNTLIYGVILILIVLFAPGGLADLLQRFSHRLRSRSSDAARLRRTAAE